MIITWRQDLPNKLLNGFFFIPVFILTAILGAGCAAQSNPSLQLTKTERPVLTETAAAPPMPSETVAGRLLVITSVSEPPVITTLIPRPTVNSGDSRIVTLDDNNTSISMHVGERFLLKLGEIYNWEVISSDPNVLSRVVNIMVIRGAQGLYEAHRAGQVELTAVGDPFCRSTKPACMMPSLLFKINVKVE
jgi:hypothetical protein